MSDVQMTMGGLPITPSTQAVKRFAGLLWGPSGSGKTSLACTAPGRKLLISFDPDGAASVAGWPNVDVVDWSSVDPSKLESVKQVNSPLGIGPVIEQYDTFIVDSLTNVADKTLQLGVSTTNNSTIERPGLQAYGVRGALLLRLVKNMLAVTGKHKKHCIFIAHEAAPERDKEGAVLHITMSLGGNLPENASLDLSEVWNVYDVGVGRKRIMFRPARNRKPCKTRMFKTTGEPEFDFVFDPDDLDDPKNMTIEKWYNAWTKNGMNKLPLPGSKEYYALMKELTK